MKKFRTILGFELGNYFKNKIFVGVTIALVVLIVAVMFFPRITELFDDGEPDELPVMLLSRDDRIVNTYITEQFKTKYRFDYVDNDPDQIQKLLNENKAACAVMVATDRKSFVYYVQNAPLYDIDTPTLTAMLQTLYLNDQLQNEGVTDEQLKQIYAEMDNIKGSTVSFGKDQSKNFLYTYIMIFALYTVIMLYGQMVATSVASEKSSRAMELLITSVKTTPLLFGKVVASCIAGFTQLVLVFGTSALCYNLNKEYWKDNVMISGAFDMPAELILYMLLFFLLGFLIYAFLYGAVGSTVSKPEDTNTAVMPLTLVFIVAFMVVVFSITSGNVDNMAMIVCSYIPFTSPMAMFTRIAMSVVPAWEIAISVTLLVACVVGAGILSAKVYRVGVLLYGNKPTVKEIFKLIKNGK